MDDAELERRIRVVVVTTRAAVRSLRTSDGLRDAAVHRGIALIDDIERGVCDEANPDAHERVARARAELAGLLDR